MRRFISAWIIWSLIWMVLIAVAYRMSTGAPDCAGPLIRDVTDSFPRQCDDPSTSLPTIGLFLYILGFFPAMVIAAFLEGRENRNTTKS